MSEEIQYAGIISRTPPEGLVDWVLQQGELKEEYLIYKSASQTTVEVHCSACKKMFTAEKVETHCCHNAYMPAPFGFIDPGTNDPVISRENAFCPLCGAEAELIHVGNCRYGIEQSAYIAVPGRVELPGKMDRFVLTEWRLERYIDKKGQSSFYHHPWTAWVVDEKKVVRLMGYQKCLSSISLRDLTQRKTFLDDFGNADLIWPTRSEDLAGTTAENCKLDRYIEQGGKCLVAYLAMWRKKPAVENLVMQGYGKLVDELINAEQTHGTYDRNKGIPKLAEVNWKEKRPHRMLGMSKEEFRGPGRDLSARDWKLLMWARGEGIDVRLPEDMRTLKRQGTQGCKELLELTGKDGFLRGARYLQKQNENVYTLRDYRRDAATAGWDLNDQSILWPKHLKRAHDRAAEAAREKMEKESVTRFRERYKALSRYTAEFDGILIRPCKTQTELTNEGKALHHCVAGYAKDVAAGKTAIFFIRRATEPEKPWYTLELDEKMLRVKQNRGEYNCDRTEEVKQFEAKWLAWLRAGAKRDKNGMPVQAKKNNGRNAA